VAFRIEARPLAISGLAPDDQAERDEVVQPTHDQKGAPGAIRGRHAQAARPDHQIECDRRQADPAEHDGERRQFGEGHLGEEERTAPEDRERDEQQPLERSHRELVRPGHAILDARRRL
jgi:hypothetical protein